MLFRYTLFLLGQRLRLLFRYPLFLLGKNPECYLNILCLYLTQIGTAVQISSVPTWPKTKIATQISSVSTWQKLGLLFRYPLFSLEINQDYCLDILCSFLAQDQDCYSNFLCFYLEKIRTAIQISYISTCHKSGLVVRHPLFLPNLKARLIYIYPPFLLGKIRTAIQISSISTCHKLRLLFRYPLFQPSLLRPRLLFRYPLFLLGKNQDYNSNILDFCLTQIVTAIQISTNPTQPKTETTIHISSISTWQKS